MRISKKQLKRMVRTPKIRPRIVKSLNSFDENINDEQDAKLTAKAQTSDTIGLLHYLVKNMDARDRFNLPKQRIQKRFMFNQQSINFNFAALHQLKLIRVDWSFYKKSHNVRGIINHDTVF